MKINLYVGGVDGETESTLITPRAHDALCFLQTADHEGSSVSAVIRVDDAEQVYRILEWLDNEASSEQ